MSVAHLVRCLPLIAVGLSSVFLSAQAPPREAGEPLPVRRVVLYKTGVGYFEHRGTVSGAQAITIRFTSAQLNDVLKSLTAIDLGKGQVTGISYNSVAPAEERLEALRLPLGPRSTMVDLLGSLRGARIEITSAGATVAGRLLSVDQQSQRQGDASIDVAVVSLVTDAGELRNFELTPAVRIRLSERSMRDQLTRCSLAPNRQLPNRQLPTPDVVLGVWRLAFWELAVGSFLSDGLQIDEPLGQPAQLLVGVALFLQRFL